MKKINLKQGDSFRIEDRKLLFKDSEIVISQIYSNISETDGEYVVDTVTNEGTSTTHAMNGTTISVENWHVFAHKKGDKTLKINFYLH